MRVPFEHGSTVEVIDTSLPQFGHKATVEDFQAGPTQDTENTYKLKDTETGDVFHCTDSQIKAIDKTAPEKKAEPAAKEKEEPKPKAHPVHQPAHPVHHTQHADHSKKK